MALVAVTEFETVRSPGMTRRLATIAIAALLPALAAGCGDEDPAAAGGGGVQTVPLSAPKRDTGPRPTPDDRGAEPMLPGEYRSSVMRPPVSFKLTDRRWQRDAESETSLSLFDYGGTQYEAGGSVLDVLRPWGVVDPENPDNPDGRKWPRDMVRFLREDAGLRTSAPKRAKVAGLPAQVLDARAPAGKDVDLFITANVTTLAIEKDKLARLYVIDAGREQRVLMLTVPRSRGRAAFAPLERIVRTLKFGG